MTASAPELARRLADAFEAARIPYALGGALALGVWGFPRATQDVDLNIFATLEHLDEVFDVLLASGCELDRTQSKQRAYDRGDFVARWQGVRIDIFVPSIPLHASAERRVRQGPLLGRPAWYLSPEDLVTFKLLFFRTKDLLDVERLVAFMAADFDHNYVRSWLVDLLGEDDERLAVWDRIVADSAARPVTST